MYLLILFLPLFSAIVSGFFGRFISKKGSTLLSCLSLIFTAIISYYIFYEVVISQSICTLKAFPWIATNLFFVEWGFLFDSLTATMLIVVTTISALVHIYSTSYMGQDPHLPRFMAYLSIFTFFMLILISGDNLLQLFVGWEGVGLSSYLLINFWHTRLEANKAAMKALIINRIGDFGVALAIALIYLTYKSTDFAVIFTITPIIYEQKLLLFDSFYVNKVTLISILLLLGAIGKSAQMGLHTWLPDAMEGPTPVSALIHAATMVTAGVFVILRCSPLLEFSETALFVATILGALTAFMAATIGIVQNDIKRVIAYSTCSQLGYMVFCAGLSNYAVSLFHLMNHAFFKALLFLSAGAVIHALADEQDMRKYGGLLKIVPVTYVLIIIGSLALMGFPFLTGFYSKDIILELTYGAYTTNSAFVYWLGTLAAFFTAFYSIRLIYLTFLNKNSSNKMDLNRAHEADWIMLLPMIFLGFGSIFVGFIFHELFVGTGNTTWSNVFSVLPIHDATLTAEFLPFYIKNIPVIFSLMGASASLVIYLPLKKKLANIFYYKKYFNFYQFFNRKWYFDELYNKYVVKQLFNFGYQISFKTIDRGFFELIGPLGAVRLVSKLAKNVSKLQTGLIYNHILFLILALTLTLLFVGKVLLDYPLDFFFLVFIYLILDKPEKKIINLW